jgi:hypothetical protein
MRAVLMLALAAAVPLAAAAQEAEYRIQRDVINGTVTTDDGVPIAGADVIVTMAPERISRATTTDSSGRYEVIFEQGTGDYLVYIRAVGRETLRRRVTREGTESTFTVNVALKPQAQELAEVRIESRAQRPGREAGLSQGPGAGAAEREFLTIGGALPPDLQGDLAAMAATMPGVTLTPDGATAFGLPPMQNTATLNGLAFNGGQMPRGMQSSTRVSSSTYDPARGGFSGLETAITLRPGGFLTSRRADLLLDLPRLQATDDVGASVGQRRTTTDMNLVGNGQVMFERWHFNSGLRLTHSETDAASLLDLDAAALRALGVAGDSVHRLQTVLGGSGVPVDVRFAPSQLTQRLTLAARIDRPAWDWTTFTPLPSTWGITAYGNTARRSALGLAPFALPSHSGKQHTEDYALQGFYSRYYGAEQLVLNETRTGISVSSARREPYVALPEGRVRVASALDGESNAVTWLSFGGHGDMDDATRRLTWQTTNETHFYWRNRPAHTGKIFAESRLDDYSYRTAPNRMGAFSYQSLEDLELGRAAAYTRTLDFPERSAGRWSGALAVSDLWRHTTRFRVLYGLRLEGHSYTSGPAYNADVERAFGVRTDNVPAGWHVSPRAGFTWIYTRARRVGEGVQFTNLGQFYNAPRGVLRGGIGEFRGVADLRQVADVAANTGLPGAIRRLSCIGDAVPFPDWALFTADPATVPAACADGATAAFTDAAPNVRLFDRSFQPPRSWRANLSWSSVLLGMVVSADGILSFNLNQPSRTDLNFAGEPRFVLADEGGRPVFARETSIVPSTGAVAAKDARRLDAFGSVIAHRSDLRSYARQLSVTARPDAQWSQTRYVASLTYTLSHGRAQARGFDGAAFGDPSAIEWSRPPYLPRHELIIQAGRAGRWTNLTLFGKVASGLPFTPMLGGDVNGDGLANDRAFIFAPATADDPQVAAAMATLLESAPNYVRDCLGAQLNRAAARNSCEGPWTASLNARLDLRPDLLRKVSGTNRLRGALNIANPLAGLDQLLHGSRLRGWGGAAAPDPILYFVRGFDQSTRSFRYEVNQRFGDTRPRSSVSRVPFRVTLDFSLDFGRPYPEQQLERFLNPGRRDLRKPRHSAEDLMRRYRRSVPPLYLPILQEADSLLLTRAQVEALTRAGEDLHRRLDSVWMDLSRYLADLPDNYNTAEALRRQEEATDAAWEMTRLDAQRVLPEVLTQIQIRLLPYPAEWLIRAREPVRVRQFIA